MEPEVELCGSNGGTVTQNFSMPQLVKGGGGIVLWDLWTQMESGKKTQGVLKVSF